MISFLLLFLGYCNIGNPDCCHAFVSCCAYPFQPRIAGMVRCLSGPGQDVSAQCCRYADGVNPFDRDSDGDVDLFDFSLWIE